jgi:cyclopropane fatty-acyl-phospholipid synthase-like methyltransferase
VAQPFLAVRGFCPFKAAYENAQASFAACFAACSLGAASSEEIGRLKQVMDWKAGQTIADVGAGEGEMGFAAALTVGQTGKVYLTELDEQKRKALEKEVQKRGLKNAVAVQGAEKQTNLPDNCCDAIILRRVYQHVTAPSEMESSLLRALKPGGQLAVIDFPPRKSLSESDPVRDVPANRGGHGIPQRILIDELTRAGFRVKKTPNDWPDDGYCVIFRR